MTRRRRRAGLDASGVSPDGIQPFRGRPSHRGGPKEAYINSQEGLMRRMAFRIQQSAAATHAPIYVGLGDDSIAQRVALAIIQIFATTAKRGNHMTLTETAVKAALLQLRMTDQAGTPEVVHGIRVATQALEWGHREAQRQLTQEKLATED
jgi:hypothetical protein